MLKTAATGNIFSKISDIFFILGILCELYVMPSGYAFGWYHEKTFIAAGMACFCVSIIFSMNLKKDFPVFALLAAYGAICYRYQGTALVLRIILALLAGRDKNRDRTVKMFFAGSIFVILLAAVLSLLGIHNSVMQTGNTRSFTETRLTLGFYNPNGFALFVFRAYVLAVFLLITALKDKKKGVFIAAAVSLPFLILILLSHSKMAAAAFVAVFILTMICIGVKGKAADITAYAASLGAAILQVVLLIVFRFQLLPKMRFGKNDTFFEKINSLTTGRLMMTKVLFKSAVPRPFGRPQGEMALTEMGFENSAFAQGYIFILLLLACIFWLSIRFYRKKDRAGLVVLSATTLYALAESYLAYFNKNSIWLMMIGICAAGAASRERNEMGKDGKKKIRIDFAGFWPDFKKDDNYFYNRLKLYYDPEICDDPDYVFCSGFSDEHFKYMDCVKIFFTGENIMPDFNLFDYALGFHYIDFEDRYLRLPLYALYDKEKIIIPALKKHTHDDEYYLSKKKFCNRVVSNPFGAGERDEMFDKLSAYKQVDSGGRYRNNVGGPVDDKIAFERDYKFTLAFENSSMSGYTTEKILEAFAGDTIPVYFGSPRIKEEFNPGSFIDASSYASFDEVVEEIKKIDNDDELYLKMMKAPAVLPESQSKPVLEDDYIDAFLKNIFDQDLSSAKRRNMVYIGHDYQKKLKDANALKRVLDVVKRPVHLMHKIKWQITSKDK